MSSPAHRPQPSSASASASAAAGPAISAGAARVGSAAAGAARVEFQAVILATSFGSALFPLTRENAVKPHAAEDGTAPGGVPAASMQSAAPTAAGSAYTDPIGRAHLPIANRPLLHYQLDMIHKAGFPQVIVVTRESMRRGVARIVEEWRVARGGAAAGTGGAANPAAAAASSGAAGSSANTSLDLPLTPTPAQLLASSPSLASLSTTPSLLDVDLVSLESYRGTADALRQISEKIHTDFFCLSGDLISNVQFQNLADLHRSQDAGLIMCVQNSSSAAAAANHAAAGAAAGGAGTPSGAAAAAALEKERAKKEASEGADVDAQYMGIDASTGRLLLFKSAADVEESLSISKRLLGRHPNFTLHTKLRDCHLYVFSQWVLLFLQEKPSILSIQSELIPCLVSGQYRAKYNEWRNYSKNASQLAALRMSHANQKQNESVLVGSAASPAAPQVSVVGSNSGLQQTSLNREYSSLDLLSSAAAARMSASVSMTNMSDVSRSRLAVGSPSGSTPESFRIFVYEASAHTFCGRASSIAAYKNLNLELAQDREYTYMPWPPLSADNSPASGARLPSGAGGAVNNFLLVGEGALFLGDSATLKRSCIGRHCSIGARVKMQGCVVMEGAVVEEGCSLTDCIVGMGATVGRNCTLKDCKIGPGFRVEAATEAKNEILCDDD